MVMVVTLNAGLRLAMIALNRMGIPRLVYVHRMLVMVSSEERKSAMMRTLWMEMVVHQLKPKNWVGGIQQETQLTAS